MLYFPVDTTTMLQIKTVFCLVDQYTADIPTDIGLLGHLVAKTKRVDIGDKRDGNCREKSISSTIDFFDAGSSLMVCSSLMVSLSINIIYCKQMLQQLVVSECYICQESCIEKSPCECQAYVHTDCLKKFCSIANKNSCTICQTSISMEVESKSVQKVELSLLTYVCIGFLWYFTMGVLGQIMVQMYTGNNMELVYAFWSCTFVISSTISVVVTIIIGLCLILAISVLRCCWWGFLHQLHIPHSYT